MASGSLCVKTNWEVCFPTATPENQISFILRERRPPDPDTPTGRVLRTPGLLDPVVNQDGCPGAGSYQLQTGERWGAIGIPLKKQS